MRREMIKNEGSAVQQPAGSEVFMMERAGREGDGSVLRERSRGAGEVDRGPWTRRGWVRTGFDVRRGSRGRLLRQVLAAPSHLEAEDWTLSGTSELKSRGKGSQEAFVRLMMGAVCSEARSRERGESRQKERTTQDAKTAAGVGASGKRYVPTAKSGVNIDNRGATPLPLVQPSGGSLREEHGPCGSSRAQQPLKPRPAP
ncbi:hypothetical protein G7046_g8816 [Stylonectria norvegica]|nr:hypothetical protein G7046_g8816 [Stylonectria norvegica]